MIRSLYPIVASTPMITLKRLIALGLILLMAVGCEASPPPPAGSELGRSLSDHPARGEPCVLVETSRAERRRWRTLPLKRRRARDSSRVRVEEGPPSERRVETVF